MHHPTLEDLFCERIAPDVERHLDSCSACRHEREAWAAGTWLDEPAPAPVDAVGPACAMPVLALLGRGGMGEVYRVRDGSLEREVAMKVLRADRSGPEQVARFFDEARLTAGLQHPAIVPVHAVGTLDDGRPYYTMKEVRGASLRSILGTAALRRRIETLARVSEAVAYAHSRQVVHRDLKPENILLGAFDELTVADWGLASTVDTAAQAGGTPQYMAPEQAAGAPIQAAADVYALGGMLYEMLCGRPPYSGEPKAVLAALRAGPPPSLDRAVHPPSLVELCEATLARDPGVRPSAADVGAALRAWLDGDRRTREARARLEGADAAAANARELRARAAALRREADARLVDVKPHAPVDAKREAWRLLDAAGDAEAQAEEADLDYVQTLTAALELDPALPEALDRLAAHHAAALAAAEARGDTREARRLVRTLRAGGGWWARWLDEPALVTLETDPEGAEVVACPLAGVDRCLMPGEGLSLGRTPLREVPLPPGRYLLRVRHPARPEVLIPAVLGRGARWPEPPPAGRTGLVPLPEVLPGTRYVPAGWATVGDDAASPDSLSRRRVWVDGFRMATTPVTVADYVAFLDDLPPDEADRHQPLESSGYGDARRPVLARPGGGRQAGGSALEGPWDPDWPVVLVDAEGALAYARWWSGRTGRRWRLPHDLEWEKAARGVDWRVFPWGDVLDPAFANMVRSHAGPPSRVAVTAFPRDQSPYGVRGLGGNVRDWCANGYRRDGDVADGEAVTPGPAAADEPYRMVRGGSWTSVEAWCRSAARFAAPPTERTTSVGFRLVCDLEGRSPDRS